MDPNQPWREHTTENGRVYFYNTQTKITQWNKPEPLMTPAELALSKQPWKSYFTEAGKEYWYNTITKQSVWEQPQEYKEALNQGSSIPARPPPQ
jgi:pre-mRNA-processing factor 40